MNLFDFAKALGVALLLMALNVAVAFGAVAVFSFLIEPGHEPVFYDTAARTIAPLSIIFAGAVLFFVGGLWFSWRRAGRNGFAFATAFAFIYAAIEIAIIASVGWLPAISRLVAVSMFSKLATALLGTWLSRPRDGTATLKQLVGINGGNFVKALGLGLVLAALNFAIVAAGLAIYVLLNAGPIELSGPTVLPWVLVAGAVMYFVAAWMFAWRSPGRNGFAFAAVFAALYVAIDIWGALSEGGELIYTTSAVSKLAAALLGAWIGLRSTSAPPPISPRRP